MGLLEMVRRAEIVPPTRRGFSPEKWQNEALLEDKNDRDILRAASWISARLGALRDLVTFISPDHMCGPYLRARALVALCNRENALVLVKMIDKITASRREGANLMVDDIISLKLDLHGEHFSPNEMLQATVDAIQIPLKLLSHQTGEARIGSVSGINWQEVLTAVNVGVLYGNVEDLWSAIVWRDLKMLRDGLDGRFAVFAPGDVAAIDWEIESSYREQVLSAASSQFLSSSSQENMELLARAIGDRRSVKDFIRNGKGEKIVLEKASSNPRAIIDAANFFYGIPEYYNEISDSPAPAFPNITLRLVVDAGRLLRSLAQVLRSPLEAMAKDEISSTNEQNADLWQYLRVVKRKTLVEMFASGLYVSNEVASTLLDFFTYHGGADQELWTQPLVHVSADALAPVLSGIIEASPSRNVDRWMQQCGYDLSLRGGAFEEFVRRELAITKVHRSIADSYQIIDSEMVFKPKGEREEEIDAVIVVGSLLIVLEAKCSVRPTTPEMWFRHEKIVEGAISQVQRKVASIERNRAQFVEQLTGLGMAVRHDFEIFPLILLNHPSHAGRVAHGVAVADLLMLQVFLRNELEQGVFLGGGAESPIRTLSFYGGLEDFPSAASAYFRDPPQLTHIRRSLKWRRVRGALAPGDGPRAYAEFTREVSVDVDATLADLSAEKGVKTGGG